MDYQKPPADIIAGFVKTFDKRIGLRMLYQRYNIPESERYKYRQLWNEFYELIPDAFEKESNSASEIRKTTKNDGDSGSLSGETVQTKPEGLENEQEETARVCP